MVKCSVPSGSKVTQREGKVKRRRDRCQTSTRYTEQVLLFRPVLSTSPVTCETWSPTTCWSQLASLPVSFAISSTLCPPSSIPRLFTSQVGKKVKLFHTSSILPFLCFLCPLTFVGFHLHLITYVFSDLLLNLTLVKFLVNFPLLAQLLQRRQVCSGESVE